VWKEDLPSVEVSVEDDVFPVNLALDRLIIQSTLSIRLVPLDCLVLGRLQRHLTALG